MRHGVCKERIEEMSMLRAGNMTGPKKKPSRRKARAPRAERAPRAARAPRKRSGKAPTAAQLRARENFARRAKSGEFRRKKK